MSKMPKPTAKPMTPQERFNEQMALAERLRHEKRPTPAPRPKTAPKPKPSTR